MAVTQYIGARYVPLFYTAPDNSNTWQAGVEYEPLTIVTYLNQSYASKIPVPATVGNPADNPTYWILTGAYNAQVEQYRQEVEEVKEDVEEIRRVALYLGNSYCTGVGSASGSDGIFNRTKNAFSEAYLYADSGVGFLTYTDHNNTFDTLVGWAINNAEFEPAELTDVIIVGAWGEVMGLKNRGTWANFSNAVESAASALVTRIRQNFPNVKRISYLMADARDQHTISGTSEGASFYSEPFTVHSVLKSVLPSAGISYLGWIGWSCWMRSGLLSSDHNHPNDAGYTALTAAFNAAYFGGGYQYPVYRSQATLPLNITSGSTAALRVYLTPETAHLKVITLVLKSGQTPAKGTFNHFIDFDTLPYMPPKAGSYVGSEPILGNYFIPVNFDTSGSPSTILYFRARLQEDATTGNTYLEGQAWTQVTVGANDTTSYIDGADFFMNWAV